MNSPPLDMKEKWFAGSTGYSIAKLGMSLVALGLSGELRGKIAVNALWPRVIIATAAIKNLLGGERAMRMARSRSGRSGWPGPLLWLSEAGCEMRSVVMRRSGPMALS